MCLSPSSFLLTCCAWCRFCKFLEDTCTYASPAPAQRLVADSALHALKQYFILLQSFYLTHLFNLTHAEYEPAHIEVCMLNCASPLVPCPSQSSRTSQPHPLS